MSDCLSSSTSDSGVGIDEDNEEKDKICESEIDKRTASLSLTYEYLMQLPRKLPEIDAEVSVRKFGCCKSENCGCRKSIKENNPAESYVRVTSAKFEEMIAMDESSINLFKTPCTSTVNEKLSISSLVVTGEYEPNTKFTDRPVSFHIRSVKTPVGVINIRQKGPAKNFPTLKDKSSESEPKTTENSVNTQNNSDESSCKTQQNILSSECANSIIDESFVSSSDSNSVNTQNNLKLPLHHDASSIKTLIQQIHSPEYENSIPSLVIDESIVSSDSDSDDADIVLNTSEAEDCSTENIPSIKYIINELINNEEIYVKTLECGITNYMSALDDANVPVELKNQKLNIFSNIFRIYDLHANIFYPALKSCGDNILRISETFTNYIKNEYFYCYVMFMLNRPRSLGLCDEYKVFFHDLQKQVDDKLGVHSFLLQPIQRLPRYQLLLTEFIKELAKNSATINVKPLIASMCKAEKCVERLLNMINDSMSINEIVQEKLVIHLGHQGKFRKMDEFTMYDRKRKRQYSGKLFLFEKCLIYTEITNKRLEYRGHYKCKEFGLCDYNANEKLCLFANKSTEQVVEFHADINRLEDWYEILHKLLMDAALEAIHKKSKQRFQNIEQGEKYEVANSLWYA